MNKVALIILPAWLSVASATPASAACADITHKICTIANNYHPFPGPGRDKEYVSPRCNGGGPTYAQKRILQKTFGIAPQHIKDELCALRYVFILSGGTHSWGKWEDPRYHSRPNGNTYIGILVRDLARGLSTSEDAQLRGLGIGKRIAKHEDLPVAGTEPITLSILATLAHVLGHIKWHRDKLADNLACIKSVFEEGSWPDPGDAYTRRWTTFGQPIGKNNLGLFPHHATRDNLRRIYTGGFATAVAAASLEEDFVETYKLVALDRSGRLAALTVDLGEKLKLNEPRRGLNPLGDNLLRAKWDCAETLFGPAALDPQGR